MPEIKANLTCKVAKTFRTEQVTGMFDLTTVISQSISMVAEIPSTREEWQIGAIFGDSGAGKTTIARIAFGRNALKLPRWSRRLAIIDQMGEKPIETLTQTLTSVGLGAAPTWLLPFHHLSAGEQFRAILARQLLSGKHVIVCDEFTSSVDRTLARNLSIATARLLRRAGQTTRMVAVTSHRDILEWLEPDWTLDMNGPTLTWRRLRRPRLQFQVRRCSRSLWSRFARHHYLSGSLSCASKCYMALEGERPIAFCAVISMLGHPELHRITRLVTLPKYQGLGVGSALLERVAETERREGFHVRLTTSHPAMVHSLTRSPHWRSIGRRFVTDPPRQIGSCLLQTSRGRLTATFEFAPASKLAVA